MASPSKQEDQPAVDHLQQPENPAKAMHQDIINSMRVLGVREEFAKYVADQVVPDDETYLEDVVIKTMHKEVECETEMRIRAITYNPLSRTFYFITGCFFIVVTSFFVAAFVKALCVLRS